MASGRKNYFRHNFNAHNDPKIVKLMEKHGLAGYAMFFILIELCAAQCESEFKQSVTIAKRTLRQSWRKVGPTCDQGLADLQAMLLLEYTSDQLSYNISIPNMRKYMGKYETKLSPNSPNKKKVKEIKRKENKVNEIESLKQVSCLSHLTEIDEIKSWLETGNQKIQKRILDEYSDSFLKEKIEEAYFWNLDKKAKRGSDRFLLSWIKKDSSPELRIDPMEAFAKKYGIIESDEVSK